MSKSLDRRRSSHALAEVKKVVGKDYATKFRSYARSFPSKIVMFGLGNAVATEFSSAGRKDQSTVESKAHKQLVTSVFSWIGEKERKDFDALSDIHRLGYISDLDQIEYELLQSEILSYLTWLKKYAQALIEKGDEV